MIVNTKNLQSSILRMWKAKKAIILLYWEKKWFQKKFQEIKMKN